MKSLFYIAVLYTVLAPHPASGQYVADPYLYYSVGGGRAISPPAAQSRIRFGSNVGISGFSCGNFDPKLDVSSMLGGIGNTLADLKSIPTAITSALPGQILCRAQPSLCNLMQHYSVRAEDAWRFFGRRLRKHIERIHRSTVDQVRKGAGMAAAGKCWY